MRRLILGSFVLWQAGVALGQVTIGAVTNSASFAANNAAPGSIATIFGTNLAGSAAQAASVPLPKTLAGATVTVNGIAAPLFFASPTQINFQVPNEVPAGTATVVVSSDRGTSPGFSTTVKAAAPGIFQFGTNRAVAQNPDGSINDASNPVAAGAFVVAYLTGQGPVDNPVPAGTLTPSSPLSRATMSATATIGGQNANILFLGLTPGFAALAQANIVAPALPSGTYPLVITVGGAASNGPMITISGGGGSSPVFTQLGTATTQPSGRANVVVNGNTAYVCGPQSIGVVDVSNASAPKVLTTIGQGELGGSGIACAMAGNNLVEIVNTQKLVVYGLSNPTQPQLLSQVTPNFPFAGYVFFAGNIGFFTTDWFRFNQGSNQIFEQHGDFYAYDFTNPSQPSFLGSLQPDAAQPASSNLSPRFAGVAVNNQTAYVASTTSTGGDPNGGSARIEIVDISQPANMRALGQVLIPQATVATGIATQGNMALVTGNTKSWRNPGVPNFDFTGLLTLTALDISNPQNPAVISTNVTSIQTSFDIGYILSPLGNGLFALAITPPADNNNSDPTGNGQLAIVDARDPRNIAVTPLTSLPVLNAIAVSGGKLYAAFQTGLSIYQISGI